MPVHGRHASTQRRAADWGASFKGHDEEGRRVLSWSRAEAVVHSGARGGDSEGAVEAGERQIDRVVDGELVAVERVEPVRGAGVKVTDKGRGRREGGGQGTDSCGGLNGCGFWRRRPNVKGAAIALHGRDIEEQSAGDGKERLMSTYLLCML
jgi:hypothetical protein